MAAISRTTRLSRPTFRARPRIFGSWAVAGGVVVAALCVLHLLWPVGWTGDTTYLVATVGAGVVAWLSVLRHGGAPRVWLAVGISASALADVISEILMLMNDGYPDVSIADGPWLASYVGVSMCLLLLLRRGQSHARRDLDGLIDMAVIILVTALFFWHFWIAPTIADTTVPLFVRWVWAAYPILDATLLALLLRTLITRRTHASMGAFLIGGVVCWLVADFTFLVIIPSDAVGALLDIGWMLGAVLLAAGCWRIQSPDAATDDSGWVPAHVGPGRIALAVAPLLAPGTIEVVSYFQGYDANPLPLLAATVALVALAGARGMRLLHLREEAQASMASSERLFRALAANSSDAVLVLDADGVITNDAPNLATMLGYSGEPTLGQRALDFVPIADDSRALFDAALVAPGAVLSGETHVTQADGGDMWLSTRAVNLLHDPDVEGIVVNLHDITDRKRAEEELQHQAFHDSLTGLANRALFLDRVEQALRRRTRNGWDPAVLYLDLDGFKNVNDGHGHEGGDTFLCEVAARLQSIVRQGDTVARLGGDEFAVLVEESSRVPVEAEAIAQRALQTLTAPVRVGDHTVTLSASLGIAIAGPGATASSLLRDADVAMYQAKSAGKSRWVLFEPTMRAAAVERLHLENDMAYAVERDQLRLLYQPVVELESNQVVGFEALLRWEHPELGTIMPDAFIPIAEENGMIIPMGRWVLQAACLTAARWRDAYPVPLTMAVNLSARQLASPDLFDHVQHALRTAGLDASALVLEMTETALIQDATVAAARLHQLRGLGVRLAIDDFGTGYSSLSYLRQFPVDILKIDRSFINTITDRGTVPAIVRGLLDLGRTLQLETLAEGIESNAQLGQLRDEHCELGQGYLFARPLSAEDAEVLLANMVTQPV